MNPSYVGDSYDLVKRFFCRELSALGYAISIDAMFTGDWAGREAEFYRLVGVKPGTLEAQQTARTALSIDPDTGIHKTPESEACVI